MVAQLIHVAAVALVVTACLGRIWCSTFIGGHKNTQLVTMGPYSLCRHPLYAFSFIGSLGTALATHSIVLVLLTILVMASVFLRAATREERFLAQMHPQAFAEYAHRTPRWLPRPGSYRLPDSVTINPAIFRKSFLDAAAFVALYLIVDTVRVLRESGVFPTLLEIP
jgi:steroid 5-alpha reductase family enzyme